jgi:hypothetical protein
MEYNFLHYDDPKSRKLSEKYAKTKYTEGDKVPGFNVGNTRLQLVSEFEEHIRENKTIIRSHRLISELRTFVYKNGRPDHMKGQHDDLIMSLAMAVYVADYSFAQLQKVSQQAKILLESWEVKSYEQPATTHFNPALPNTNYRENPAFRNQPSLNDYKEYSWLFGSGKR